MTWPPGDHAGQLGVMAAPLRLALIVSGLVVAGRAGFVWTRLTPLQRCGEAGGRADREGGAGPRRRPAGCPCYSGHRLAR